MNEDLMIKYFNEREGLSCIYSEHGFVLYKMFDNVCYISDVYIDKDKRGDRVSFKLVDRCAEIASGFGATSLICSVDLKTKNPENGLSAALKYGFKIADVDGKTIYLAKDLANG